MFRGNLLDYSSDTIIHLYILFIFLYSVIGRLFVKSLYGCVRASVRASVSACVRPAGTVCLMFPRYLQYPLTDFRHTFVIGASETMMN